MKKPVIDLSFVCQENLEQMPATEKGIFCTKCNKDVHDLREKTREDIQQFMQEKNGEYTCVRIKKTQLLELNFDRFFARFRLWTLAKRLAVIIFFGMGAILFSCSGNDEHVDGKMDLAGAIPINDTLKNKSDTTAKPDNSLKTIHEKK